MRSDEFAHDRQAEAAAPGRLSARGIDTEEAIEDPLAHLRGNAGSIVLHGHTRLFRRVPSAHRHVAPFRSELDRVVDQVAQHLIDALGVRAHRRAGAFGGEGDAVAVRERPETLYNAFGQLPDIDEFVVQANAAFIELGQGQQILDCGDHAVHLLTIALENVPGRGRKVVRAQADVDVGTHDRQRRAQLMGGVGHQTLLLGHAVVDAVEHRVERNCEVSEFVAARRHRQPRAEVHRPDRLRRGDHAGDRPHGPSRESPATDCRCRESCR